MPLISNSQRTNPTENSNNDASKQRQPISAEKKARIAAIGSQMIDLMKQLKEKEAIIKEYDDEIAKLKSKHSIPK